jgi:chemotaxis protein MotB
MRLAARRSERSTNIWPGFVDALATLLIAIIFLVLIFVLAQFFLNQAISGRDEALDRLRIRVSELADLLALERRTADEQRDDMRRLAQELQVSVALRDDLRTTVEALTGRAERAEAMARSLGKAAEEDKEKILAQLREIADLGRDIEALKALRDELEKKLATASGALERSEAEREEERKRSEARLADERRISESERAQVALLNRQLAALREQLAKISEALEASERKSREQGVEIAQLGGRLNAALASRVQELSRYRSEFFGRLRDVLGRHPGVRVVGDRFVFQSELFFETGSADIGEEGKAKLDQLFATLGEIAPSIPPDIDWILQVEGHTDRVPIFTPRFPSNWDLSLARANSVVQYLIVRGVPPRRLAAAGFGEFHPLDDRNDEIANRRNRRIELRLTQR